MPRSARADIGRRSRRTQNRSNERENQSQEQREQEIANTRERVARSRSDRRPTSINQNVQRRAGQIYVNVALNVAGFRYNHAIDYSLHKFVVIGGMNKVCQHCNALKFHNETPGMCCASGKVRLPELQYPPEPLATLISGTTPQSKHFLHNIQMYNSCFKMTSFGATNVIRNNFMPTFKVISALGISNEAYSDISELFTTSNQSYFASQFQIQGQIYHRIGSLLPFPDANHQFLQIYFLGNNENEVDARCSIFTSARRIIIRELQALFHEHNDLINTFRTALDQMPSDDHKIVIRADRRPIGEHERL